MKPPETGFGPKPATATVYLDLGDQLVKSDGHHPTLTTNNSRTAQTMSVDRGQSNDLLVDVPGLSVGQQLYFVVEDTVGGRKRWWISNPKKVPPDYELHLTEQSFEEIKNRTQ